MIDKVRVRHLEVCISPYPKGSEENGLGFRIVTYRMVVALSTQTILERGLEEILLRCHCAVPGVEQSLLLPVLPPQLLTGCSLQPQDRGR